MSTFPEMEWNGKWDWENLMMFGSKVAESPKKLQLTEWGIEDEGDMDAGSFNLSGGGSGSGRSMSDLGNGSSIKSSISASTDSSPEDGIKTSSFRFDALKGSSVDFSMKSGQGRAGLSGASPPVEASVGSGEPLIGLKLGKRTYFENSFSGCNAKSPSSVIPVPSNTAAKKIKSPSGVAAIPRCQVEGCNIDLSSAKDYHRKHRVCDSHSKCPKVIVGGVERRFCQQCSRFHSLSEFDEKKRSCRRRLSDHNARRRKPQQETIQFNSSRLPSPFYDGRHQMNFMLNDAPLVHARNAAYSDWESTPSSKFTITRACPLKSYKTGSMSSEAQVKGNQLSHAMITDSDTANRFLAIKGAGSPVFSQGLKNSGLSPTANAAAPELRRALSLLSNSWGSFEPESVSVDNLVHVNRSNMPQTVMHGIPQGLPLASSEYWLNGQQSSYPRVHTLASNSDGSGHWEGIQVFKTCHEADICYSSLN